MEGGAWGGGGTRGHRSGGPPDTDTDTDTDTTPRRSVGTTDEQRNTDNRTRPTSKSFWDPRTRSLSVPGQVPGVRRGQGHTLGVNLCSQVSPGGDGELSLEVWSCHYVPVSLMVYPSSLVPRPTKSTRSLGSAWSMGSTRPPWGLEVSRRDHKRCHVRET